MLTSGCSDVHVPHDDRNEREQMHSTPSDGQPRTHTHGPVHAWPVSATTAHNSYDAVIKPPSTRCGTSAASHGASCTGKHTTTGTRLKNRSQPQSPHCFTAPQPTVQQGKALNMESPANRCTWIPKESNTRAHEAAIRATTRTHTCESGVPQVLARVRCQSEARSSTTAA